MQIAVLGATGGQGGAVVKALLAAGHSVRAVVRELDDTRTRRLASTGAKPVQGRLSDVASLASAFDGVSAAFAVTTPFEEGLDAEIAQGAAIIEAAESVALPHLVMSSVASADQHTGIPHFETKAHTERLLAASGLPTTVVAPTYFYDNALGGLDEVAHGRISMALPADVPLQQVSRRDLGRVVAAVMEAPQRWIGRRVEIAGDEPTPAQMARTIGAAAGGTVEFRQIPLAVVRQTNPDMGAMFTFLTETRYQVDLTALRGEFPHIPWVSFEDWAAEQNWPTPR